MIFSAVHRRQAEDRLRLGPAYHDRSFVFCLPNGDAINPDVVRQDMTLIGRKIGRPWLRPHNLRHTFVPESLRSGTQIKTVQELAGHANAATTLQYPHVQPGYNEAAATRLEVALDR